MLDINEIELYEDFSKLFMYDFRRCFNKAIYTVKAKIKEIHNNFDGNEVKATIYNDLITDEFIMKIYYENKLFASISRKYNKNNLSFSLKIDYYYYEG